MRNLSIWIRRCVGRDHIFIRRRVIRILPHVLPFWRRCWLVRSGLVQVWRLLVLLLPFWCRYRREWSGLVKVGRLLVLLLPLV